MTTSSFKHSAKNIFTGPMQNWFRKHVLALLFFWLSEVSWDMGVWGCVLRAISSVILDKFEPSDFTGRSLKLGGLLIYPLAPWSSISQQSGRQMSGHMLPDWGFEREIPLIGWTGTGPNPRHPRRCLPHPPPLPFFFLHVNKRQEDEKDNIFPIPCFVPL